jgi:hypothetical protein
MGEGLNERATPMTLITPVSRARAWRVWVTWRVTRLLVRISSSIYPFGRLRALSFIHFAHWTLLWRVPPNRRDGRKLPHPYLIFQTNFNRGWREYVEAFCLVIPWGIRLNWGQVYGFPPPKPVGPFLRYVDDRFTQAAHFYCAYPRTSTRMVLSALDARGKFDVFAAEGSGPPPPFLSLRRRKLGPRVLGRAREGKDTLSVLCPIVPGEHEELERTLKRFDRGSSPLARVRWTHMARWSVVKPLPYKGTLRHVDPTWYLLFVSWFDGTTSAYIEALREGLGEDADRIWSHCEGFQGSVNPALFEQYMVDHSLKPGLAFAGYRKWVSDVRAGLELRALVTPPVVRAARKNTSQLEHDWKEREGAA